MINPRKGYYPLLLATAKPAQSYNKESSGTVLLTTGASSTFSKQNIYDIAGNVDEWTLEYTFNPSLPCARRGGRCSSYGSDLPASNRGSYSTTTSGGNRRFSCVTLLVDLYPDSDTLKKAVNRLEALNLNR